jgi:hypothetical protein
MVIRKALVALASAGMVLGSTAAAAAPVAVDDVRAASPVGEAENLKFYAYGLVFIIILGVILIIASDSDEAISP